MEETGNILLNWYGKNKRVLPWRETSDPYKIWLSEIILQQTRVNQGMAYYLKFVNNYPDIKTLASAPADEVFKLWQGLGYYNRAENMMKAAQMIMSDYGGEFPRTANELKRLPGIGNYTAAAIASIAFGEAVPVVDGNVYRWLSRMFLMGTPINSAAAGKEFAAKASGIMAGHPPGIFNQAMMEFGALYCVPESPGCSRCVFKGRCQAYEKGVVEAYPVKKPKTEVKKFSYYYFHIETTDGKVLIHKRERTDIWKNLYDFPSEVFDASQPSFSIEKSKLLKSLKLENAFELTGEPARYVHRLTHRIIYARFFRIKIKKSPFLWKKSLLLVDQKDLKKYPVPRLIERYLQDENILI